MKKILWIEDDIDFIPPIKLFLEHEGWEVHTASSVDEGEKIANKIIPDLIIMDIIMDKKHGFSGIEDFKENPLFADKPTIIFSSLTYRLVGGKSATYPGILNRERGGNSYCVVS